MQALLQRVSSAKVEVKNKIIAQINRGLLVFLAIEKNDSTSNVERLTDRVIGYRIFPDEKLPMNVSVQDIDGEILLVSQFTLAADTKKGMRPSFSPTAEPELAEELYNNFLKTLTSNQPVIPIYCICVFTIIVFKVQPSV